LDLPPATKGDVYDAEDVVDHYVRCAQWKQEEYDRVVTDWEIARGFEQA
jgi:glutamine synthetase